MQQVTTLVFWPAGDSQELWTAFSSYLNSLAERDCVPVVSAAARAGRMYAILHVLRYGLRVCSEDCTVLV